MTGKLSGTLAVSDLLCRIPETDPSELVLRFNRDRKIVMGKDGSHVAALRDSLRKRYDSLKSSRSGRGGPMPHTKDAGVPLVSQIGQLDPDSSNHIIFLWGLLGQHWGNFYASGEELAEGVIVCFLFLEDLLQGQVSPDVLTWINDNQHNVTNYFEPSEKKFGEGATAVLLSDLLLEDVQVDYRWTGITPKSIIAHELRHELKARLEEKPAARSIARRTVQMVSGQDVIERTIFAQRCEDCQNAFMLTRGGQRFCSTRCGLRHAARRRRNSKKAS